MYYEDRLLLQMAGKSIMIFPAPTDSIMVTVNHSIEFVNTENGYNTNRIESI